MFVEWIIRSFDRVNDAKIHQSLLTYKNLLGAPIKFNESNCDSAVDQCYEQQMSQKSHNVSRIKHYYI